MLDKIYSYEECIDEKQLFKVLDNLRDKDLIDYRKTEWTIQIFDQDMSSSDESKLLDKFDELCVYPEDNDEIMWIFDNDDEEFDVNY